MPSPEAPEPVEVPYRELSAELLHAVVESFVLREGTDYGEREYSFEEKVAHVMRQLQKGEAKILFDPESESVTIAVRQNSK
ncbi:MAG TPA: YheU family protein [Steroidobacteraceae bacterium]|nr:YheU family protein [Steroidobacteraceae bacterium]